MTEQHQQDGYVKYDKDYLCWWFYPNNATGERFVVRHDPRDGTRLNANGTETPLVPAVTSEEPTDTQLLDQLETAHPIWCAFCGERQRDGWCSHDAINGGAAEYQPTLRDLARTMLNAEEPAPERKYCSDDGCGCGREG